MQTDPQKYTPSVDELKVAAIAALTVLPNPDEEDLDASHLRIGEQWATVLTKEEVDAHEDNIADDPAIAAEQLIL